MKYFLTKEYTFEAAHFLRDYDGPCANMHGHSFSLHVTLFSPMLNEQGMVLDFKVLKSNVKEVIDKFDHSLINDIKPFDTINPTVENLAEYIFNKLEYSFMEYDTFAELYSVKLWETKDSFVEVKK